jgi:hypothetical protein
MVHKFQAMAKYNILKPGPGALEAAKLDLPPETMGGVGCEQGHNWYQNTISFTSGVGFAGVRSFHKHTIFISVCYFTRV